MITKYRKKPVIIEAIQWNGKNLTEIETENPYFDGDIYPNKYDYVKKHPENVIVKFN